MIEMTEIYWNLLQKNILKKHFLKIEKKNKKNKPKKKKNTKNEKARITNSFLAIKQDKKTNFQDLVGAGGQK